MCGIEEDIEFDEAALERLEAKIERDNVHDMNQAEWVAWLDALLPDEFVAMAVKYGIAPSVQ